MIAGGVIDRGSRLVPEIGKVVASAWQGGTEHHEEREMPSIECPNCDGSGYTTDASGQSVICPLCDGTGTQFVDEGAGDVETAGRTGDA